MRKMYASLNHCVKPLSSPTQEFPQADDTCYLAHCYPYTYSDLKDDLETLLSDPERSKVMQREVMCETRAGNSCFLLTVTNFGTQLYLVIFFIFFLLFIDDVQTNVTSISITDISSLFKCLLHSLDYNFQKSSAEDTC